MANAIYSRVAHYEAEMQRLRTENSQYGPLSCSFSDANATHSRVAQCEGELEGLQIENSRYA